MAISEGATWAQMFARQLAEDVPAVALGDKSLRTTDLAQLAAGAAQWLDSVGAGEDVAIPALLTTTQDSIALAVAGTLSSRPLAPLNPRLTARELAAVIARLRSPIIVAESSSAEIARAVAEKTGRQVAVVADLQPSVKALDFDRPENAVAVVLHTSGTTGLPKAVEVTQHKLALRAQRQGAVMGLGPGATFVSFSPLSHIAGLGTLFIALGLGATAVPAPPFSTHVWRSVRQFQPTHAQLVPTMIEGLLAEGALEQPSLRVLLYGSSIIRPLTLRRAMDILPNAEMLNMYGQTEGSPLTFLNGDDHRRAIAGRAELLLTVGRAVEGVELRIEGPNTDGEGEVCARAEHLFRTEADGWLRTGDVGTIDADGYVRLVGRKGDVISRGGEKVYPVEVEHVLAEHEDVAEAAVVGIPDERLGQTVRAFVVPADPANPPDPEDLRSFARERLAGFKVPVSWVFVAALPRSAVGKLLRRELPGLGPKG